MTRKQIEKALPEGYGIDKADGVYYFNGNDCIMWPDTCSNFCTLDHGTIEQWVSIFNYLRDQYEERSQK